MDGLQCLEAIGGQGKILPKLTLYTVIATQVYLAVGIKVSVTHYDVRRGWVVYNLHIHNLHFGNDFLK